MKPKMNKNARALLVIWSLVVAPALMVAETGCMAIGAARYPTPTAGFRAANEIAKTKDGAADHVAAVCANNRIPVASIDKANGLIRTDWIQGVTQLQAGGLFGAITTRYKYDIRLSAGNTSAMTKVGVMCTLESSSENLGWHDISKDNGQIVHDLEAWLYERIEKTK